MKVNGIIAEYNPFHNGHQYHLEESLRRTGADYTIIAMSGNFVQRGAPALLDKHARARMALLCGADLVLELPALYAASSAEYFAAGAVSLLDKLGTVTHLCFGSECADAPLLLETAALLAEEPEDYRRALKDRLRQGSAYPAARAEALMQCRPALNDCRDIFSSPNSILAIEYCKALLTRGSKIQPVAVERLGPGYHDLLPRSRFCSAQALRQALCTGSSPEELFLFIPPQIRTLLAASLAERHCPLRPDDFSALLHYKLLLERGQGYRNYLDVSGGLSNRIQRLLNRFHGFEDFCALLKSKDMTYTRISRCLLHILLDIRKEHMESGKALDYVPYARVLGFRRSAAPLLAAIRERSSIPLVTKLKSAEKSLGADALRLLGQDILCSEIYRSVAGAQSRPGAVSEYSVPIVVL